LDEPCQLARVFELDYVTKISGEEIDDEEGQLDLEEDQYEEEVR